MLETLKQEWHYFKEGSPGKRFQQHFKRRQQSPRSLFQKALFIGGGTLVMAAGLFFLPAPGPGTIILLIGAALIAQESALAAHALDWAELRLRKLAVRGLGAWHRFSPVVKSLLVLVAVAVVAMVGFGTYKLLLKII